MRLELAIILILLSAGLTIAFLQTRTSIDLLIPEIGSISQYLQDLRSQYETVSEQHASQSFHYDELQAEYGQLQHLYSAVTQNYTSLDQYLALNDTLTSLTLNYSQLMESYTELNASFMQYQQEYHRMVNQINRHTESTWPHGSELITPQDPLVEELVYQITGKFVNIWDGVDQRADIYQLYDWVYTNIQNRIDGYYPTLPLNVSANAAFTTDMWQFPNQTISENRGDSEDRAILLCSLIRSYSGQTLDVECMRVADHAVCYIFVPDGQICILDPTFGYATQTGPVWRPRITYENVNPEMSTYFAWSGTEPVYYIFSDVIERQFANTQEFIDWMNDRF